MLSESLQLPERTILQGGRTWVLGCVDIKSLRNLTRGGGHSLTLVLECARKTPNLALQLQKKSAFGLLAFHPMPCRVPYRQQTVSSRLCFLTTHNADKPAYICTRRRRRRKARTLTSTALAACCIVNRDGFAEIRFWQKSRLTSEFRPSCVYVSFKISW